MSRPVEVWLAAAVAALSLAAHAETTTVALYRCGEEDRVAPGDPAGAVLKATLGTDAVRTFTGGSGQFTNGTPTPCSSIALELNPLYTYSREEYLNGRASNWGMEAWLFLPASLPSQARAFSNGNYGSGIGIRGGNWVTDVTADVPVAAELRGTWANVAFVYDGGVERWYVNRSVLITANRNATWTGTVIGDLHIGTQNAHNGSWPGAIDEVRIFTFEPGMFDPDTDLGACEPAPRGPMLLIR